jgi:hypothetical protein
MSMAASMIAQTVLKACCGDGNPFEKFDASATTEEKKEDKVDPQFKSNFWNQDLKFELTEFKKLPIKARKAAEELGYTEEKWNNSEGVDSTWEHWWDLTESQKKNLEILGWEETAWESQYQWTAWNDLPKVQKKAAKVAGYTEETWEEGLDSMDKWWGDLSKDQREAMCVMGWTEKKWDDW